MEHESGREDPADPTAAGPDARRELPHPLHCTGSNEPEGTRGISSSKLGHSLEPIREGLETYPKG